MAGFNVGPGLSKRIAQYADQPAADEVFIKNSAGKTQWSETVGRSGRLYRYIPEINEVHVFDSDSSIAAGAGPDPAPPGPPTRPAIIEGVSGVVAGSFTGAPSGVILHSTRSGQNYSIQEEFNATVNYVRNGSDGLGWNVTIGSSIMAPHISPRQWGWNAREHSSEYLAVEFAQAKLGGLISDEQVAAFVWWFRNVARATWPNLPAEFPTHAELPAGQRDGKTDPEPRGQHSLRDRILAALR